MIAIRGSDNVATIRISWLVLVETDDGTLRVLEILADLQTPQFLHLHGILDRLASTSITIRRALEIAQ